MDWMNIFLASAGALSSLRTTPYLKRSIIIE
jgi:hypothetical protein